MSMLLNCEYYIYAYMCVDDSYEELLAEVDSSDSSGEVLTTYNVHCKYYG